MQAQHLPAQIYWLLSATAPQLQQSLPPEPIASRQRESFPWKKILSEGSQKEIPERSCQDPCALQRCLYTLLCKPESPWISTAHALQSWEGSGKAPGRLQGCWVTQHWPWMSGGRALQPPPLPAAQPTSKTPSGGSSLPFSCWFRITFHPDSGWYSAWLSPRDGM